MAQEEGTVFHLPKAFHRTISGNRGANLRYVFAQTGCKILLPRSNPEEIQNTNLKFVGDEEQIANAKTLVEEKLGFPLSEEPLSVAKYVLENEEEVMSIVGENGAKLREANAFGCGIQLPRRNAETYAVTVQGTELSIQQCEGLWAGVLGRVLENVAEPDEKLNFKVEKRFTKIAEALFFSAPDARGRDGDDAADLRRFLNLLRSGERTLDICVFTITNNRIADAIDAEWKEGLEVRIISDNDQMDGKGSDVQYLANQGIPVKIDTADGHMHNKFAIIDGELLMNGSFNWTVGAAKANYENVTVSNDKDLVAQYQEYFNEMWEDRDRFVDVNPDDY